MPPGVTNLPECPIEGCDDKIDMCCAVFSGESQPCSGIYNNDPLCQILYQLLELTFPPSYCCALEGTIEIVVPTTTTTSTTSTTTSTSTTTTSSSTTTTTTLLPPITCNCYRIYNPNERAKAYTWKDCENLTVNYDIVGAQQTVYRCSLSDSFLPDSSLIIAATPCADGCPPVETTTTTTTIAPDCDCIYMTYTGDSTSFPITYVDCTGTTSDPFTLDTENNTFYVCGSNPETTDTDVTFYIGAPCSGGNCTASFTVSNSLSSSSITQVDPGFYTLFAGNTFPVTYTGFTATINGVHADHSGSIVVYINNTGSSGCLELIVSNVIVDSSPVPGFTSSIHTLTCPSGTLSYDTIKINLRSGPC